MKEVAFVEVASQMGGVEFSTLYLARRLDRTRWCPLVICPEDGDLPRRCREADVEVSLVPRSRFFSTSARVARQTLVNPFAIGLNVVTSIAGARPLARFLRRRRPALIVTKGLLAHFYGGLAARLARIPCVWHLQDRVTDRAGPFFPWMLGGAGRILARQIIVDANSIGRQLRPFVPAERISIIPNGVDTDEFTPWEDGSGVRTEWGARAGDILIGVVARLTPWKGQGVLLEALARIADRYPQARAVLVGTPLFESDDYARELRSQTERLGLVGRVVFAGFHWDLPRVLSGLDVVVHTSLEKDSSPLALASAMAAGKPIISTSVDGTGQLFEDGVDGLLVPPGDVGALAESLSLLLDSEKMRASLGQAARATAERELNLEQFAERCTAVFDRAIGVT